MRLLLLQVASVDGSVMWAMSLFVRVSTRPGKSWIFSLDFPGPGKSWKITLVLESPESESLRSWKVLGNEDLR